MNMKFIKIICLILSLCLIISIVRIVYLENRITELKEEIRIKESQSEIRRSDLLDGRYMLKDISH